MMSTVNLAAMYTGYWFWAGFIVTAAFVLLKWWRG